MKPPRLCKFTNSRLRRRPLALRQLHVEALQSALERLHANGLHLCIEARARGGGHHGLVVIAPGHPAGDQGLRARLRELAVRLLHAANGLMLQQAAANAPVEVRPGFAPLQAFADDSLGLHAAGAVVQVGELASDLCVDGRELRLPGQDLTLNVRGIGTADLGRARALEEGVQALELRVQAMHELHLLRLPELHLHDSRGLQDAATGVHIGVHLHL
mmetsp:Transcript_115616/g.373587  ORF Transcript_115616/g.373587 Transcript_115616/m.373587 type:complete len:216 (-) Transcript_115616:2295-2942(-)